VANCQLGAEICYSDGFDTLPLRDPEGGRPAMTAAHGAP